MDTQTLELDAAGILAIPLDQPRRLFDADPAQARQRWRRLCSIWHPDRNDEPLAASVFSHIQNLYRNLRRRNVDGPSVEVLSLESLEGKRFRLRYRCALPLDIGTAYVGDNVVAYLLDVQYADLARHADERIRRLQFADAAMHNALARTLPRRLASVETAAGVLLVLPKEPDFVPLRALLSHVGGSLPARHVAWITSALLNLVCYLDSVALAHQSIDLDHCLVSPANHAIALTGGWWYANEQHHRLLALPARSMRLAPPDVLSARVADVRLDQFLLRATALEILGSEDAPEPMRDFLTLPPESCPVSDYEAWQRTLWKSFGPRRFTPLDIDVADVYAAA